MVSERSRPPDLSALNGVRSGKLSYYVPFRRSSERLQAAVHALDEISPTLVHTAEGPRALLVAVLHAAAAQLEARWVVFAIADDALPSARPRSLAADPEGRVVAESALSADERTWIRRLRQDPPKRTERTPDGVVVVPMTIDGEPVGGVAARTRGDSIPDPLDLAVVRILMNQAAVALHTAYLYHSGLSLRTRAEQLTQEASQNAHDLALRNQELAGAQELLSAARDREVLTGERSRIARELHDSVTQHVLSAGMLLEACTAEVATSPAVSPELLERLAEARALTQRAVGQLRVAIHALHHGTTATIQLPHLLEQACGMRGSPSLEVDLRLEGNPVALSSEVEHSLARLAGEALFNVSSHSGAGRCVVRLSYRPQELRLTVDDDGHGDPAALRSMLRVGQAGDVDGRRQGLVNMASRTRDLGGRFALRRSRLGGVRAEVRVPLPVLTPTASSVAAS